MDWVGWGLNGGTMAMTYMEAILIGGMVVLCSMSAVSLWYARRTRQTQEVLVEGIANAFGVLNEQLKSVESIPQILQELNLGGVQLMPQKTLGETIMENIMAHFFKREPVGSNIDPQEPAEPWPDGKSPENQDEDSPELISPTSD